MLVTSKIKTLFPPEVLRYAATICDNKRIESNNKKMVILGDLLYTNGISFEVLGGATNRIALQIDGYAIKFALDEQGYQDNLVEYSLSPELQPYVTKSYETNGYIQIQECVEVMTKELFQTHRNEIYKILDLLCQDYLLGDVGYISKNRTNWGIRAGKPVILDYAYCHRATENLFTCSRCGAPLKYDSTYDKMMCSDRSGCSAIYTYNERKRVQGNQVDIDMIKERKAQSIKLSKDEATREIETFGDKLVGDNYFIIDSPEDYYRYRKLKEEKSMKININGGDDIMATYEERFAAMVDLAMNQEDAEAKSVILSGTTEDVEDESIKPIYTEYYEENFLNPGLGFRQYPSTREMEEEDGEKEEEMEYSLDDLIEMSRKRNQEIEDKNQEIFDAHVQEYLDRKAEESKQNEEPDVVITGTDDECMMSLGEMVTNAMNEVIKELNHEEDKRILESLESDTDEGCLVESEVEETQEEPTKQTTSDIRLEIKGDSTDSAEDDSTILVNGKPITVGKEVTATWEH